MGRVGRILENRIISTLRINPNLTYNHALLLVLRSEGVIHTTSSITVSNRNERSALAVQSNYPTGQEVKKCTTKEA